MINRLDRWTEGPEENHGARDYWVVEGKCTWFYVTEATAREIVRSLARDEPRAWLRFADLFGAEVWIASDEVKRVSESTSAQRQAAREFRRERRDEEKDDRRPWEDDDWY